MEYSEELVEAAHRAAYVVQQYPEKPMEELLDLFKLPAIEFNAAFWLAEDLGLISDLNAETNLFTFIAEPEEWRFGKQVQHITDMIVYGFNRMALKETELDETQFGFWTMGYNPAHVLIAMKRLLQTRVMAEYELTDPEDLASTYTFYTLYENAEQMWGKARFAVQPTGNEVPIDPLDDTPEEDKHLNDPQEDQNETL